MLGLSWSLNLNPVHPEVYSTQQYVIKFVSGLRQDGVFSPGNPVSSTNKSDRYNIAEILLKRALRSLDRIVPAHLFRAWLSRIFHHKTMHLSARCNGKVRVTDRKQFIQKLCEHFNKKSVNYCQSYLPLILALPLDCLQINILTKQPQ